MFSTLIELGGLASIAWAAVLVSRSLGALVAGLELIYVAFTIDPPRSR